MVAKMNEQEINAARMVLDHPVVTEVLDDMEKTAMDNAVNAKPTDTETPAVWLAEVRAIRKFRSKLRFMTSMGDARESRERP